MRGHAKQRMCHAGKGLIYKEFARAGVFKAAKDAGRWAGNTQVPKDPRNDENPNSKRTRRNCSHERSFEYSEGVHMKNLEITNVLKCTSMPLIMETWRVVLTEGCQNEALADSIQLAAGLRCSFLFLRARHFSRTLLPRQEFKRLVGRSRIS